MPGAPESGTSKLVVVPHKAGRVLVLRGEECDVVDYDGNTDLQDSDVDSLDWTRRLNARSAMPKGPAFGRSHYKRVAEYCQESAYPGHRAQRFRTISV